MNRLTIVSTENTNNRITVTFEVTAGLKKYFQSYVHFNEYDADVSNCPTSLAVIPFICNVLPLIWLTNSELHVDEIDEDFYQSISGIKQGYSSMYQHFEFEGGGLSQKKPSKTSQPVIQQCVFSVEELMLSQP